MKNFLTKRRLKKYQRLIDAANEANREVEALIAEYQRNENDATEMELGFSIRRHEKAEKKVKDFKTKYHQELFGTPAPQ
jgi:hypothetical protein